MSVFVINNGYKIVSPTPSGNAGEVLNENFIRSGLIPWRQTVIDRLATPPGAPAENDRYLIIATATGVWTGQENRIAEYIDGAWNFTTPLEGWIVRDNDQNIHLEYNGTAWLLIRITENYRSVSANTTAVLSDYVIDVDASGGAVTITLPPAASAANLEFNIRKLDSSSNDMIVDGDGAETINGSLTQSTKKQYTNISVFSNGTEWIIL